MKNRMVATHENSLFKHATKKSIPIDGLPCFIENIWTLIKDQKDLNLPGEKAMVATFRCNEFKEEAFQEVQADLKELQRNAKKGFLPDFQAQCKEIEKRALVHYQGAAKHYH